MYIYICVCVYIHIYICIYIHILGGSDTPLRTPLGETVSVDSLAGKVHPPRFCSCIVPDVDNNCRRLIVPLFRGSSRCESLILSHHSRRKVACECNE